MNRTPFLRRLLALSFLALGLFAAGSAHAQINVDLQIKRHLFILNEPILATVTITNQSGNDIMLADTKEGGPWFSFQITDREERTVPPRNPNYELQPLNIRAGDSVKRTVNLNELYSMGQFGTYHVKSSIFFVPVGKYFASRPTVIELSDGRTIWKQTVGVPGVDNDFRTYSLLTLEQNGAKWLYVRLSGENSDVVYGCYSLGRMLAGFQPDAKLDAGNNLAVLTLTNPKTYSLSRIGVDGSFLGQNGYVTAKTQPYLRKTKDGQLQIVGATRQDSVASTQPDNVPKLSDRPPGFESPK